MNKKVIFIKLKNKVCTRIKFFEESFENFKSGKTGNNYYNFPMDKDTSYLNELIDGEDYYFFASVYDHGSNGIEFIKSFLGIGKFSLNLKYRSLELTTKYSSNENNMLKSLRKLSALDINKDFADGEYVTIEESEYLFNQIDFILNDAYECEKNNRKYNEIDSEKNLHPLAQRNEYCRRQYNLREPQENRGEFQRDYERIVHSKAFRRMVDKAQVFSASKGDYYRTRMTHSQAVAQIAKGIAAELNLNLVLTEAIALGHDIGHTPFGHQGERTLNDILNNKIEIIKNCDLFEDHFGGFKHNYQSIRVASQLEEQYFEIDGMDLSYQTLEGMLKHTRLRRKEFKLNEFISAGDAEDELYSVKDFCSTLEGQIVAVADEIAQRGHDLDDALSSGIMSLDDFKKYMTLKKVKNLEEKIEALTKDANNSNNLHRKFSDENELMNSRIVSTIISYFINDVITSSGKRIDDYSVEDFKNNGFTVDEKLIDFSEEALMVSQFLETIITNNVINSPEIALFDNNGETIVSSLFKAYYKDPRLLHKGTQRRIYAETRRFTQNVVDFELGNHKVIRDEIQKITKADLNNTEEIPEELFVEYKNKRKILVRNICDFISGMTDTYAINEYRRIEKQL